MYIYVYIYIYICIYIYIYICILNSPRRSLCEQALDLTCKNGVLGLVKRGTVCPPIIL